MSIKYVPLTRRDYVPARAVFRCAFAYSEWSRLFLAWKNRAEYGCYAAWYGGALVGFSLVSRDNIIKYIAVDPEYQGFKIGSSLLTRVLASMGEARTIRLTTAGDERLLTWYGRFGFCVTETLRDAYGEFVGAHMVRRQRCRSAATA
jgi:ribosomal protein S18 acetylase RimI-like enzyme